MRRLLYSGYFSHPFPAVRLILNLTSVTASPVDPSKELTTEEMRKLIERNEIVQTNGLKPYNTVNI